MLPHSLIVFLHGHKFSKVATVQNSIHVNYVSLTHRADVHGTELLGIIAAYFDENTLPDPLPPGTRAMLLNVALAGLRALAEAEVCLMHSRCVSLVFDIW